ncbi:MAG: glycosyltransferase [Methanomethylophilus sp.]
MSSKVIVTTNPANHEGGVVNYYNVIFKVFDAPDVELVRMIFGSRMEHFYYPYWLKGLLYPFYYIWDLTRLLIRLLTDKSVRIVQVSPSLVKFSLCREAPILLISKILKRKTIVFFRGWRENEVALLQHCSWRRWLFNRVYGQCERTFVLLSQAERDLQALGFPGKIVRTTTLYEAENVPASVDHEGKRPVLLFLGRVSQLKGIGELLEAVAILRKQGGLSDFQVEIVGHGERFGVIEAYEEHARKLNINDIVHFAGRQVGEAKKQAYAAADIYVFPSWTEGCPNSVLEAMGAGLYVVGTRVGALPDLLNDEKYGVLVPAQDSKALAAAMARALSNLAIIRSHRKDIQEYAEKHFESRLCADFLLHQYRDILQ